MDRIKGILKFLELTERLKNELRHSWLTSGRQESVAEHVCQMGLMAVLIAGELEHKVNLEKTLKLILVHDLAEAKTGDIPFFEESERKLNKVEAEAAAMREILEVLPADLAAEIHELWLEFEDRQTPEAKFVKALDNLEVQIQHNLAEFSTWEEIEYKLVYSKMDRHCNHDKFLARLCDAVKDQGEQFLIANGIDVGTLKEKSG